MPGLTRRGRAISDASRATRDLPGWQIVVALKEWANHALQLYSAGQRKSGRKRADSSQIEAHNQEISDVLRGTRREALGSKETRENGNIVRSEEHKEC